MKTLLVAGKEVKASPVTVKRTGELAPELDGRAYLTEDGSVVFTHLLPQPVLVEEKDEDGEVVKLPNGDVSMVPKRDKKGEEVFDDPIEEVTHVFEAGTPNREKLEIIGGDGEELIIGDPCPECGNDIAKLRRSAKQEGYSSFRCAGCGKVVDAV